MNTLITALTVGQLACVGVLAWIATSAIHERERARAEAERNYAAGETIYEAACMYMRDHGITEPDTAELETYVMRVIDESPDHDQPE